MNKQSGFTLIELIMVIVILGILAATALPRFVNVADDARTAALNGVVGGISSANSINVASSNLPGRGITTTGLTCQTAIEAIMEGGVMPNGFTADNTTALVAGNNACTITQTDGGATTAVNIVGVTAL